jgi:hypothetical protein
LDSKIPTFSISNSSTEEKLQLLGIRRDLGELSEEDYNAKKKELLGDISASMSSDKKALFRRHCAEGRRFCFAENNYSSLWYLQIILTT